MADREPMTQSDLLDQASDWGTTVTEATAKKGITSKTMLVIAFVFLAAGSVLILPAMASVILSFEASGAMREMVVVGIILALAFAFKRKSSNLPRNSLQIDYRACEVRLGAELPDGTFVREQVIGFRDIEQVYVDSSKPKDPALCLRIDGEIITMRFHQAEQESLDSLVNQIAAARESALRAPVRSRIQSRIMGFEASFREAKQRIRTRIVTRTAT